MTSKKILPEDTMSAAIAPDMTMRFFTTSTKLGKSAVSGGLDKEKAKFAKNARAEGKTSQVYLPSNVENARIRIGSGKWLRARGAKATDSVENLHSAQASKGYGPEALQDTTGGGLPNCFTPS